VVQCYRWVGATLWLWREGFWLSSTNDACAEKLRPPVAALQTNSLYSNKEPALGKSKKKVFHSPSNRPDTCRKIPHCLCLMHINSAKFTEPKARFFRDRAVFGPWSPADLGTNLFFDGHRQDRTKQRAQSDMICPSPNRGRFPPKPQMKNKILLEVTAPTRLSAFLESPFPLCRAERQTSARCL